MELTSRERLLRCIKRQPIDRIPISTYELAGWDREQWYNKEPSYALLMEEIRQKADCIAMNWAEYHYAQERTTKEIYIENDREITRTIWHTEQGSFTRKTGESADVKTVWNLEPFLKDEQDVKRFLCLKFETPTLNMEPFYQKQRRLGENGIMTLEFGDPLCEAAELMGMEEILTLLLMDEELAMELLEKLFEHIMLRLRLVLQHDVKDVMFRIYGAEYATPPYFSPAAFPNIATRFLKPMCEAINAAGGISRIHSHGNVRSVMDEIIKTGAMCVDPLEPPPDGDLPLAEAKERYGDKIILMGNIEYKDLEAKSEEEITELVKQAIQDGGKEGFILLPSATPINIPLAEKTCKNMIAMLDAGHKYGRV